MITLFTGLPGNGKTLFALYYLQAKAKKENREVFYHNINIIDHVALPWTEFDPEKWMDLPHGAMIVIDESQDIFPKKPSGAKLPDFYSELAKHRHKGFDIFLITQHPTLLDNFVRQLVGQHFHSIRKFGMSRSTIYEWSAANPSPQSASSQKSAIVLKFPYPKQVYGWYKSAEVHTVKRSVPAKLILAIVFVISIFVAGYFALHSYQNRGRKPDVDIASSNSALSLPGAVPGVRAASEKVFDPVADARHFVQMNTPRIAGLPQTAPKFDALTVPVRVPVPAMCLQRTAKSGQGVTCKCYTQQGTPMNVDPLMCVDFARDGFFQEFDSDRDRTAKQDAQQVERSSPSRDSSVASAVVSGGAVVLIPESSYESKIKGSSMR